MRSRGAPPDPTCTRWIFGQGRLGVFQRAGAADAVGSVLLADGNGPSSPRPAAAPACGLCNEPAGLGDHSPSSNSADENLRTLQFSRTARWMLSSKPVESSAWISTEMVTTALGLVVKCCTTSSTI